MRLALSVIFSLALFSLAGQTTDSTDVLTDSITMTSSEEKETELVYRTPFVARIYVDYGKLLLYWTDFESKAEAGVEFLLSERYQLILEAGSAVLTPDAFNNATYRSEGQYARIGIGYLGSIDDRNKIGLGLRYGQSFFEDEVNISIPSNSGLNDEFTRNIIRNDLSANWMEVVLNSERKITFDKDNSDARINSLLSWGLLVRYRILFSYDAFEGVDVYSIPGFGRSFDQNFPAVNFFIKVNLGEF